ncbi:YCF48-related protein [Rubrivirga sp. IMCC45206]|uniref:YCF48-related protein n=1 Tax=Rubrivirga sp. IMCC45206 TaxID=3391614 RepID=UPI0039903884
MKRALTLIVLGLLCAGPDAARAQGEGPMWERLPGPFGGWALAIASAPTSEGLVIVASAGPTLFRSTDGATSWTPVDDSPANVRSLVTAADGSFWAHGSPWEADNALSRSTDGGRTWTRVMEGLPSNEVRGLAALPDGSAVVATPFGLYALAPEAEVWEPTALTAPALSVAASPEGALLAGTEEYGGDQAILHRSADGGTTWEAVSLPAWPCALAYSLAFLPGDVALAFAYCSAVRAEAERSPPTLFRSADGGRTWAPVDDPDASYVDAIHVGPDAVYGANVRSADGGLTWDPLALRLQGVAPGIDGETLLATLDAGVLRSGDAGRTWTDASAGFGRAHLGDVAVGAGGRVFATAPENTYAETGLYRSFDGGQTWDRTPLPFVPLGVYDLHLTGDTLFVAPERRISLPHIGGGLYRSADDGETWTDVTPAFDDRGGTPLAVTFLEADLDHRLWAVVGAGWVGDRSIYRSDDGGRSWERRADLPGSARSFTVARDGSLWAAVDNRVVRSTDGAASWETVLDSYNARLAAIAVTATGTVVATGHGAFHYRSVDGGATWETVDLATGEAWHEVDVIVETGEGVLFAGVDGDPAIVRSTDDGQTWAPLADGLPTDPSHYSVGLTLDRQGHLWAALGSKGLFRTAQAVAVRSEPAPGRQPPLALSVLPNPFRGVAGVTVTTERPLQTLVLDVFDASGRRVARLHSGPLAAGAHTFGLEGAPLAAGVYVVRAASGGHVAVVRAAHVR